MNLDIPFVRLERLDPEKLEKECAKLGLKYTGNKSEHRMTDSGKDFYVNRAMSLPATLVCLTCLNNYLIHFT